MTIDTMARRVMGTTASVIVHGDGVSASAIFDRLDDLESAWSRFRSESELSRMNASSGAVTVVSDQTFRLVDHLVAAQRLTDGRFDPTLHDQLVALGYDRTYRALSNGPVSDAAEAPDLIDQQPMAQFGRCDEITLIGRASAVLLPAGIHLDPGGLGKGFAADLVAGWAMEHGAAGVLVEIGGDIVTRGLTADGEPWRIDVPATEQHPEQIVELTDGAVATSDTAVRTWSRAGSTLHHILDPETGRPLAGHLTVTVVAGAGWWAEAVATAAMVSTARNDGWFDAARAELLGVTAFVTTGEPAHA